MNLELLMALSYGEVVAIVCEISLYVGPLFYRSILLLFWELKKKFFNSIINLFDNPNKN